MHSEFPAPDVPSFIREADPAPKAVQYNFWAPERVGDDVTDYATGQRHFATAVTYSRANSAPNTLAYVVGAMCGEPIGPIESGFLDMVAAKATVGRTPAPLTDAMLQHTLATCAVTLDDMRQGEEDARMYLDIARADDMSILIRTCLDDIVSRQFGPGALTAMWTICGAAYLGTAQ